MKITPVYFSRPIYSPKKQIKTQSLTVQNQSVPNNSLPNNSLQPLSFHAYPHFWLDQKKRDESVDSYLDFNLNFIKDDFRSNNEYTNLVRSNQSMQAFVSGLYSATRREYYSNGGITNGEFVDVLKQQEVKDIEEILLDVEQNHEGSYPDVTRMSLELRHDFFKYLIAELSKLDADADFLKDGEDVMIDIATSYYKKIDNDFAKYNQKIKKKLHYSSSSKLPRLNLQDEIKKLPLEKQIEIEEKFNGNYRKMTNNYVAEGCIDSRAPIEYSEDVDTALIHRLDRYVQRRKNKMFRLTPLTRRLRIDDMENFMKQFNVGEVYSYPRTQSCSKDTEAPETWFSDDNRAYNVIFRIHPKSRVTKAFDIPDIDVNKETNYKNYDDMHERKFRHEVLYPPNARFRVLGTHKYIKNNFDFWNRSAGDYYKTIIDLKEV